MTDCVSRQTDLDKLATWEKKWKMTFHPDKCQVLTISKKRRPISYNYTLHGHTLEDVSSAKLLGSCTINSHLDWGEHINNICNEANRTLSLIRRNLNISSTSTKETAYKALVRPHWNMQALSGIPTRKETYIAWRWSNVVLHDTLRTSTTTDPAYQTC
jgi:hypothetical protein